jgi:hypothetical protein
MTVQLGATRMLDRLHVEVDVTVTCQPAVKPGYRTAFDAPYVGVDVVQRIGNRHSSGYAYQDFNGKAICNGQPHVITVAVTADLLEGSVFRAGRAYVSVDASASWSWLKPGMGWYTVEQNAWTEWTPVRLRR